MQDSGAKLFRSGIRRTSKTCAKTEGEARGSGKNWTVRKAGSGVTIGVRLDNKCYYVKPVASCCKLLEREALRVDKSHGVHISWGRFGVVDGWKMATTLAEWDILD